MTDGDLMRAVQDGDMNAFGRLVRRHHPGLRGYLVRLTQDEYLADDLAQEAFLRVFTQAAAFQTSRPFQPWLYRIATNLFHDFSGRRREIPREWATSGEIHGIIGPAGAAHRPATPYAGGGGGGPRGSRPSGAKPLGFVGGRAFTYEGDHSAPLIREEKRQEVRAALARLTDDERALLLLRFDRELPLKHIAAALEIPLGTVKSRLFRTLKKFRTLLDENREERRRTP